MDAAEAAINAAPEQTVANMPRRAGGTRKIYTPNYALAIDVAPTWVPLASLIESTDDHAIQNRDRSRRASDVQVHTLSRPGRVVNPATGERAGFNAHGILPGDFTDRGAPIVGGGSRIVAGHGRKRILEALASEGRFGEYLAAANEWAQENGYSAAPEGMENPVLVNRIVGNLSHDQLVLLADLSNKDGKMAFSPAETAENAAAVLTPALMRLYNPGATGNLLAASNHPFMRAFLDASVGGNERARYTDADGRPTLEAAALANRALMTAIFGKGENVREMLRSLLERAGELSLGALQRDLVKNAGRLLAMRNRHGAYDIVSSVADAAYDYIAWRLAQQRTPDLTLRDHHAQRDMFAPDVPPMTQALAALLEADRFGAVLDKYTDLVARQAEDAQQMLGTLVSRETPLQLLARAERAILAEGETPVTPDPSSPEAAAPVQTPPAVRAAEPAQETTTQETTAPAQDEPAAAVAAPAEESTAQEESPAVKVAQDIISPPLPQTFTPVPAERGTATLPGPGAAGHPAHQVSADGTPSTTVRTLPPGAYNLLRTPYDPSRPPAPSAQDKAGRGLGIANPPPTGHADIFPHFMGNKTEMAARTSQALRKLMSPAERAHYTTVVDYFGGGGCWGLYHALENFPNATRLVVNEFDPARLGKIRLLHEIDGQVADEAGALLLDAGAFERIRSEANDSSSPSTIAGAARRVFKNGSTLEPRQRAILQAFVDCASTMLATAKDAAGNVINDTRIGIERVLAALREDGRKAKAAADEFKARGGAIEYVAGDAEANSRTLPHGDNVISVADPPYYLTADYQGSVLGLRRVPDNWSYQATREFLRSLVDKGDGIIYTDEAWWNKDSYAPNANEQTLFGATDFEQEQETLLDIINTFDHFDVAGRVAGRQETLGIQHGHAIDRQAENGADGDALRPEGADNVSGEPVAGTPVLAVAAQPQAQSGDDGASGAERGRDGAQPAAGRAGTPAGEPGRPDGTARAESAARQSVRAWREPTAGERALAREVIAQDISGTISKAAPGSDPAAVDALVRHSVRQVREERMSEYAASISKNARLWLKDAEERIDERMKAAGFTEKVWHGTYGKDFNVFKFTSGNHDVPAAYFTYNRGTAQNYAALTGADYVEDESDETNLYNTRQFYINPGKVLDLDESENPTSYDEFKQLLAKAYADGYNAVRVKNALDDQGARLDEFDNGPMTFLEEGEVPGNADEHEFRTDILIVMQQPGDNAAARIKAADPVTFLDEDYGGMPVPLDMRADQTFADVRYSVAVNPRLREDVEAALVIHSKDGGNAKPLSRRQDVIMSENLPLFGAIGLPDMKVICDPAHLRKINGEHLLTLEQIVELPARYNDPAVVFKDGEKAFVVITDMVAPNKAGVEKSVMVRLSEQTKKSGERLFLASAYSREAEKESEYTRLVNTPGAPVYFNENKVAALVLEQGTKSTLQSLASRDDVVTPEGLTRGIVPPSAAGSQERYSVATRQC